MNSNNHNILSGVSKLARLKFLLKDSIVYGGAAAVSKAVALVTFPLLARHFSISEYGMLDFFLVLGNFLTLLFVFGQDSAVARYFYEYESDEDRSQLISQSLSIQLLGLIVFGPFLWIGASANIFPVKVSSEKMELFAIVLLQIPFFLLINFSQNLLKWTFRRTYFLIVSLGFTVSQAVIVVAIVLRLDASVKLILVACLATSMFFAFLGIFFNRAWLSFPKNAFFVKKMLWFAAPYGFVCALDAVLPMMQRTIVAAQLGVYELGLFAVSAKIAMLMGLLVTAFQTAWGPFATSLHKQEDAIHTYNAVLKLFVFAACMASLALTFSAPLLIDILASPKYHQAALIVFPLTITLVLQAIGGVTEIGITISKRSYLSLYSVICSFVITLLAVWYLTLFFGILGIALGAMLGQIAKVSLSSWLAQRAHPMSWEYAPFLMLVGITMAIGLFQVWVLCVYGSEFWAVSMTAGIFIVSATGWRLVLGNSERKLLTAGLASLWR